MTLRVLYVPFDLAERVDVREIDGELASFQGLVGGRIASIYIPHVTCIGDDEAKLRDDWLSRINHRGNTLATLLGWPGAGQDLLAGNLVFCGEPDADGFETGMPDYLLALAGQLRLLED